MDHWQHCLQLLQAEIPQQQFNTWIRPLHAEYDTSANRLNLYAPNAFVLDWFRKNYLSIIEPALLTDAGGRKPEIGLHIGTVGKKPAPQKKPTTKPVAESSAELATTTDEGAIADLVNINPGFTFDTYVEGKSNQLARAAGMQIGANPGKAYNPLFIYGGVGLGKTHLMHAIGNLIGQRDPNAKVLYMHSEMFVNEMVKALQHNSINEFKRRVRSVNALLIDDVQFFANKDRTQEEFFHTFNALFESNQQIILTSDRFPKEVEGLEDRLKSRFGWGLTVAIEIPDLETRVAILKNKAITLFNIELPNEVAFFIGQRIRSNIRELEGALRRVIANAQFTGKPITLDFARDALRDMIAAQDKQISISNIQKTVAEYFGIRTADLTSAKRTRTLARPRQVAMCLAKELTNHSLPEIGEAFGGRDHTTVLYAIRKVAELRDSEHQLEEDYKNLFRTLSH